MIFTARKCNAIDLRGDWVTRCYILTLCKSAGFLSHLVYNKIRKCLQMPIKIRAMVRANFCRRVERRRIDSRVIYAVFLPAPHPIHHRHGWRVRFTRSRLFIVIKRIIRWRDRYVVSNELRAHGAMIVSWILTRVWRIYRNSNFTTFLLAPVTFVIVKLHL